MFLVCKGKNILAVGLILILLAGLLLPALIIEEKRYITVEKIDDGGQKTEEKYIKWIDFNIPYSAMNKALELDIKSYGTEKHYNWIEILAYLASKYYGHYSRYKAKDMDKLIEELKSGKTMEELTAGMKLYPYYLEAYTAVLGGFVGEYEIEVPSKENPNQKVYTKKYGLKVFSPIASGYNYSSYDDFGDGRSYGYKRKHMGNDLIASVGTPVIAVESGYVEAIGWNQYGGWRIGIRSLDSKRYYYYAHLRKDQPYHKELVEGQIVKAGDVIGYVGMTGYSRRENVNNIKTPHLHFGMQIIFNEVQKDGINQIWIDTYNILKLLKKNRSAVWRDSKTKDFYRVFDIMDPNVDAFKKKPFFIN